ncbi:hypothetical protein ACI1US_00581 [Leucobacter sp. BZR 635]
MMALLITLATVFTGSAAHPRTPTLDDFDLSAYSGGLCVSMASPVDAVIIIGSSALILGVAALLIGQFLRRRA